MILPVLATKSKELHQRAKKINKIDDRILDLARNMIETKKADIGIGLAGNQVGVLRRIIVTGGENIPEMILINPEITKKSEKEDIAEESCLSLPGIAGQVTRSSEIQLKGRRIIFNKDKPKIKEVNLKCQGLLARILQHEIDHLDGILFSERISDIKTIKKIPEPYKIVFFGTPLFSVPILEALIKNKWGVSVVITEKDKPVGRKQILTPPPVKHLAQKYNLLIYQPGSLSSILNSLKNLKPDVIILAAYGKILPKEILRIPEFGALCIHPSLLPKYRGASPIQTAILNGDAKTGVTIFKMDEEVDHGKIIQKLNLKIQNDDTAETLSQKLATESATLLLKTLPDYLNGKIRPKKQNEKRTTYTKLIKKEDGYVNKCKIQNPKSKKELRKLERKIRAYYPWPKVWTEINGKRIIIHKAHINFSNLKSLSLVLDIVQPEGKKPMKYEDYLKGNREII